MVRNHLKRLNICAFIITVIFSSIIFAQGGNLKLRVVFDKSVKPFYENVDLNISLMSTFSDVKENTARIVHVIGVSKESITRKVNDFVRDEKGDYVYFKGSYYRISDKRRYSYDEKQKKFVVDKNGRYVYLQEYAWARKQEDKYVISDFYALKSYEVQETKYFIFLVVTDIEISTFFIKSITPIVGKGSTIEKAIENAHRRFSTVVNEYSPDKLDIAVLFEKGFDPVLRTALLTQLQEDTRYNIYDRLYIDEVMEILRTSDLFGVEQIVLKFRPPKYLITFENLVQLDNQTAEDRYYFFENPVNGQYIRRTINGLDVPVRVEVGGYYRYDSTNKRYVFDIEKGSYVKYYKGPWEKDNYVFETRFYDYNLYKPTRLTTFYSFLMKVFDTQKGTLVSSKFFSKSIETILKEPVDRFGSEVVNFHTDGKVESYYSAARQVQEFLQTVFPLTAVISETFGEKAIVEGGKNIGAKPGYVFQSVSEGYTTGFLRLEKVLEKSSEGKIFYIVPGDDVEPHTLAFETKMYPNNIGLRFGMFMNKEAYGMKIGYIRSDIYGNYLWSLTFSLGIPYNANSQSDKTIVPMGLEFSKFLFGENFELVLGTSVKYISENSGETYISDYEIVAGVTLSSYVRNSVLSYGGACFYTSLTYTLPMSNFELSQNNINISLGFDLRF
ncbi:hypothetical protein SAMN04488510_1299 [Fervidobacterium changbaicum]|uniref:Uncharacterized protein n=1 Tax=Fervidobacterium changbaicum TaxID=310769 RepID=A0ABX5QUQ9_9BACT|nr:hypothetical protein CBS1_09425 [Fervidobacterium changbaicum]SDH73114.1 hypothetical protein SAMN04488510_1299 [Fervidobacterium changbaicum]